MHSSLGRCRGVERPGRELGHPGAQRAAANHRGEQRVCGRQGGLCTQAGAQGHCLHRRDHQPAGKRAGGSSHWHALHVRVIGSVCGSVCSRGLIVTITRDLCMSFTGIPEFQVQLTSAC